MLAFCAQNSQAVFFKPPLLGVPPSAPLFSLKAINFLLNLSHPPSQGMTCMQERADSEDKTELDLSELLFFSDNLADYPAWSQKIIGSTFLYCRAGK